MDIRTKFVKAIEATQDPLAAIKLQEAYSRCSDVGRLMASIADKAKTIEFSDKLLKSFPDEMDHIARDPSFICALAGLLSNALVEYSRSLN